MILQKLVVGPLGTNCYIFGSSISREVVIIDPGADDDIIIDHIEKLNARPIAILLTHCHFDHTMKVGKMKRYYKIPLMYNEREFESGMFPIKKADRWLKEGDLIKIGEISLLVLETPGHSPGSLCFYTKDVKEFNNHKIGGIIFTGDLIFRRSIGRSDIGGGNQNKLFQSIRQKIMNNPNLSDNFLIFPGHMESTSILEERQFNFFKDYFL